ncbi:FIG011178: rRNA methylase [hydrothermal vent metagenome]|uniref:FIG011178: rRNA methylase n=1 Tax=hydrothermal vent metagenome TaxID=652676 RepID=A0A3B1BXA8_9ZZZZ
MLTQKELKYFSSLKQKKYRQKERKFIVEGKRLVNEALKSKYECEIVIMNRSFADKNNQPGLSKHLRSEIVSDKDYQKLTDTKSPQGITAVMLMLPAGLEISGDEELIVALENISDPGNVGTIIRTCDWFGVRSVIISPGSVDLYNPKVIRSTMGSLFHINIFESDDFYDDLLKLKKKGMNILCSDMDGKDIFTYRTKGSSVLIMSNEAHGPTEDALNIADEIITIPKQGNAESLNVASAASVMIAQLTKS